MSIVVERLGATNLPAAIDFISGLLGRRESAAMRDWRYRACPSIDGAVAMVGGECVGTMFALRRTYAAGGTTRETLEPFEWHSSEAWRAQAPGFRLARHFMRDERPLVGVPGTDAAAGLLQRLRWKDAGPVERYTLPLTGRFLRGRGRGRLVAAAFDVIGRPLFRPSPARGRAVHLVESDEYPADAGRMAVEQTQFALMRVPDPALLAWLHAAPGHVGRYRVHHVHEADRLVGWILSREFHNGELRVGEILEIFLRDDARHLYGAAVAAVSARLARARADVLIATSSSPDAIAAFRAARYRLDDRREIYTFGTFGPGEEHARTVLADGAIADHAFFPVSEEHAA